MALSKVWVHIEENEGAVAPISLEILTKARELADTVEAFTGGDGSAVAEGAGAHGATKVFATGDLGGKFQGAHVAAALAALVEAEGAPDAILFGTTYDGRDIAARLSVKLDKPVVTNNTDIEVDGSTVKVTTPVFGGNTLVATTFTGDGPFLAAFRPKSFAAEPAESAAAGELVAAAVPDLGSAGAARVVASHVEASSGPKLDEASIVVSGGRGLGEASKFEMIEQLATLLKGAAGASRAIVDAGWVPYSMQVGQTGKVVKPNVYIACGISGATQHMVGMKGSKNIIAINKDQEAPIFGVADLGIVGDVHKVLPKLIEALQNR